MRKINKQTPILGFNGSKFGNNCSNWDDFHKNHHNVYEQTRLQVLISEQDSIDGYTEIYINELKDCHIDHFKKKSIYPQLTFDWNNLIVATKDSEFGANYKDNQSGINTSTYSMIFNPVTDNVENYFHYNQWGEIEPKQGIAEADEVKAIKTIEVFNLNHKSLVERRKVLIKTINSCIGINKIDLLSMLATSGFKSLVEQELV